MAGIATPKIEVTRPDGDTYLVQVVNADLVAYDVTAYKHKWPPFQAAPMLWSTFLAWHASRREGITPRDLTYEQFRDTYPSVAVQADPDPVDPTQPDPGSDY